MSEHRIFIERATLEELLDLPEGVSVTDISLVEGLDGHVVLDIESDKDFGSQNLLAVYGPIFENSPDLHLAGFEPVE